MQLFNCRDYNYIGMSPYLMPSLKLIWKKKPFIWYSLISHLQQRVLLSVLCLKLWKTKEAISRGGHRLCFLNILPPLLGYKFNNNALGNLWMAHSECRSMTSRYWWWWSVVIFQLISWPSVLLIPFGIH